MKKIKILLLIFIVLFLTGCNKDYTLYIDDKKITETFDVKLENSKLNQEMINLNYYPLHADNDVLFKKQVKQKGNDLIAHFSYSYKPNQFVNANSINSCFNNKKVIVDNKKYYYISLSGLTNCMTDYNLNINIITNNKVVKNNADKIRNNKYTWYLTNDNKNDFKLEMKILKGTKVKNNYLYLQIFIIGLAIIMIIIMGSFIHYKLKSNNKF